MGAPITIEEKIEALRDTVKRLEEMINNSAHCTTAADNVRLTASNKELWESLAQVGGERDKLNDLMERLFDHCIIVLHKDHLEYPLEHNPHANKDMKVEIIKELERMKK